jgi:hypothetical protein
MKNIKFLKDYFKKQLEKWTEPEVIKIINKTTDEVRGFGDAVQRMGIDFSSGSSTSKTYVINKKRKWHHRSQKPKEGRYVLITCELGNQKRWVIPGNYVDNAFRFLQDNTKISATIISWRYLPKPDKQDYDEEE